MPTDRPTDSRKPRATPARDERGKFLPSSPDGARKRNRRPPPVAGMDARFKSARRILAIRDALSADLGAPPTERQKIQIEHAASLVAQTEGMQQAALRGEAIDMAELTRLSNLMHKALRALPRKDAPKADRPRNLREAMAARKAAETAR